MKIHTIAAAGIVLLALAVPFARAAQEDPVPAAVTWEYEVIGLVGQYGSAIDYLKGALKAEGSAADKAVAVDEEWAKKTEDVLNEKGAEGWELVLTTKTSLILKRPRR